MKKAMVALCVLLALAACSSEPETVEVTRLVEVPVEVTRQVEVTVEVTHIVEVQSEVTRLVEATRLVEVPIEVTRVVTIEEVVTATPRPTPTIGTQVSDPAVSNPVSLIVAIESVRDDLVEFAGMMDSEGSWSASRIVELYDRIAAAPEFGVAGMSPVEQNAYNNYRSAVANFTLSTRDLAQHARDFLASGEEGSSIPFQQWGPARQAINSALDLLHQALQTLEA
jgi:hypothetical protein